MDHETIMKISDEIGMKKKYEEIKSGHSTASSM